MSFVSSLLARSGLAGLLGFQMNGLRNMYMTFGWKKIPIHIDFVQKYRRQAVARRVINSYPDAMWSDPPLLEGDDAFQTAWNGLLGEIPLFSVLQRLDKLCGLGKYAVLVFGFDDGQTMDRPVKQKANRKVMYMQPYAEGSIKIKQWVTDTKDPRYGLPLMYTISPGTFETTNLGTASVSVEMMKPAFDCHWTRILHVAEGALESGVFGMSRLEPIYNDLDDLEKITGGSAEVFWLNARQGLHIDVDKDMDLAPDDASALQEEIDEYTNHLRRVIRTRGVKVSSLGASALDPTNVYDVCISNISAGTGIPKKILYGSETGMLASQEDRANWSSRCEERVSEYGNPVILLPLLRRLIDAGVLPRPQKLSIQWPDQFKMNPLERAQTSAQMARSAANLAKTLMVVQQINHANAMDSQPQPLITGGFGANAASSTSSTSGDGSTDPAESQGQQEPAMRPPLFAKQPPILTLLSEEECRRIIGFGKHMPVFDIKQDDAESLPAIGSE